MGARAARRQNHPSVPPGASIAVRVVVAAMMIAASYVDIAWAQRSRPTIVVTPTLRIEPAVRAALPIQIVPPEAVLPGSFVRMRGLPVTAALSDGHSIAPGAWAIPIAALPKLMALLPAD